VVAVKHDNNIGQQHSETVGAKMLLSVQGNRIVAIEGNQQVTVRGGESIHSVEEAYLLDASKTITEKVPEKITLQCEGSSITLEPNKITIKAGGGATLVLDTDALL
jgi:type VI secretion system secreted protein VgrG